MTGEAGVTRRRWHAACRPRRAITPREHARITLEVHNALVLVLEDGIPSGEFFGIPEVAQENITEHTAPQPDRDGIIRHGML